MPAVFDLVSVEETLEFLKRQNVSDVPDLTTMITRASSWLELMLDRQLKARAFTNLRMTGPDVEKLYLDAWPVSLTAPITVTLDGTALTVWRQESDGDPEDFNVVVGSDSAIDQRWGLRNHLYRYGGWVSSWAWNYPGPWFGGRQPQFMSLPVQGHPDRLVLSYTGGYDPVPDDLKLACLYLIQKLVRDIENQGSGATAVTPTGGSVSFAEPDVPVEVAMLAKPYARNPHLVGVTGIKRLSRFAVSF